MSLCSWLCGCGACRVCDAMRCMNSTWYLGPSPCSCVSGVAIWAFVLGRFWSARMASPSFGGGRRGGLGVFSRCQPVVGEWGNAEIVVCGSSPRLLTRVRFQRSFDVVMWCEAFDARCAPPCACLRSHGSTLATCFPLSCNMCSLCSMWLPLGEGLSSSPSCGRSLCVGIFVLVRGWLHLVQSIGPCELCFFLHL